MSDPSPVSRRSRHAPSSRRRPAWAASLLALTGCTPAGLLTQFDSLTSRHSVRRVAQGVAYGTESRQTLDIWAPAKLGAGEALPVVIFFYGGGWNSGSRGDYGFAGAAFASKRFIAVVPDYRLVPDVRFPSFVEDGALAVKWVRDTIGNYGGDPHRITVAGHSAGAYIAAMLTLDRRFLKSAGVDPRLIRSAALLSGPYDFYPFNDARARGAFGAFGRHLDTQPITFVHPGAPPIFLGHGGSDRVVSPRNSRHLAERLREAGTSVTLRIYPGIGHPDLAAALAGPFRHRVPVLDESAAFLQQHSR